MKENNSHSLIYRRSNISNISNSNHLWSEGPIDQRSDKTKYSERVSSGVLHPHPDPKPKTKPTLFLTGIKGTLIRLWNGSSVFRTFSL